VRYTLASVGEAEQPLGAKSGEVVLYDRKALIDLIRQKALLFGQFTLASGKTASYYLDCRRVTLDSRGAYLIACGMLECLQENWPDAVGGMAIGADPITGALLAVAASQGKPLKGFIVRKEAKTHGTGRLVEGPLEAGDRCVIVEDVVTSGGSSLQAIQCVESLGMSVTGILAVVDRQEGAAEAFAARGYPFRALLTVGDLGL